MATLHLGIIAPEFPPDIGGMASLAGGFADELSSTDRVTVYARTGTHEVETPYPVRRVIQDHLGRDSELLRGERVDAWLALNGGLIPLLPYLDAPMFVYLHGSDFLNPWISYGSAWLERIRRPYMARLRKSLRRAALRRRVAGLEHVFVNSARTCELAESTLGIRNADISIVPPGVDDRFFQERTIAAAGAQPERLRLLTVTRLTRHSARKNVDGVLQAVAILRDSIDIDYTVVGDGDDLGRLADLSASLGLESRVRFAGRLSDEALLEQYRNSDLFVLAAKATTRDIEGFGIVYLESSASGVPVICSRAGGAIDAVTEGENGILIPDSSPQAIADGIRRFARERASYTPQRVRAVAERYRWKTVGKQLHDGLHDRMRLA